MRSGLHVGLAVGVLCLGFAATSEAGMAAPTLEDIPRYLTLSKLAKLRLDAISFFLAGLLASGWMIQLIWNSLAKDFFKLPRISYVRSLALVALWGLLFLLVLTMISGARELMTPGAWRKNGLTYELAEPARPAPHNNASKTAASENIAPHDKAYP
jgi:hypothetical protein